MLDLLAQTYNYSYDSSVNSGGEGIAALFGGAFLLLWLAIVVVAIVALWRVFEKAGVAGWKAIIPVYNYWCLAEIAGKPGWWGLVSLIAWVPIIGPIATLVVYVILALELAKRFGKDTTFAILGLVLFNLVGLLILGFGDAKYSGTPYNTLNEGSSTPKA